MKDKLLIFACDYWDVYDLDFMHFTNNILSNIYGAYYISDNDNYLSTLLLLGDDKKIIKIKYTLRRFIYDGDLLKYIKDGYLFTCPPGTLKQMECCCGGDFNNIYKQRYVNLTYSSPVASLKIYGNGITEGIFEYFKNKYNNLYLFENNKEILFTNIKLNSLMNDFIMESINKIINAHNDDKYLNLQFKDCINDIIISLYFENNKIDGFSIHIDDDVNILDKINLLDDNMINKDGVCYKTINRGFICSFSKMDKQEFISSDKYIKFINFAYKFLLKIKNTN